MNVWSSSWNKKLDEKNYSELSCLSNHKNNTGMTSLFLCETSIQKESRVQTYCLYLSEYSNSFHNMRPSIKPTPFNKVKRKCYSRKQSLWILTFVWVSVLKKQKEEEKKYTKTKQK